MWRVAQNRYFFRQISAQRMFNFCYICNLTFDDFFSILIIISIIFQLEMIEEVKEKEIDATLQSISEFFLSKSMSDFSLISSDSRKFCVHLIVIAVRSKNLYDSLPSEKNSNQLKLKDMNGSTLKELLRFIYTGECKHLKTNASNLLNVAEKYGLPELKLMCADSIIANMSAETINECIILAQRYKREDLMENIFEFIKS